MIIEIRQLYRLLLKYTDIHSMSYGRTKTKLYINTCIDYVITIFKFKQKYCWSILTIPFIFIS